MTPLPALPLDAEIAIPHRLPLRLVDRLLQVGEASCVAEAGPRPDHPFADAQGRLPGEVLLEMMAQSFAALRGYRALATEGPVGKGYLVAVRGFRTLDSARSADRLEIHVSETGSVDAFHMADVKILRQGRPIAEGSIRVWTPGPDTAGEG